MQEDLSPLQIDQFITQGFIKLENAFPTDLADQVRDILWRDLGINRNDSTTWTKPVIRLGMYSQEPFVTSANTSVLHRSFDQLVGVGKWLPCHSMGTFPVRFPSDEDPGDAGWHVDASFPGDNPANFWEWRVNVHSKGRALLMLFLYSDVSERDAPTRIRTGSHMDVARALRTEGEAGLSFMEIAGRLDAMPQRETALATGKAGTVYLCHPFLVHAAQPHRGKEPKFMAQPPLLLREELSVNGNSPIERAIWRALS
ncbi:phytanoyl-CoA dioxygenase family protein [Dyadobacter sp. CY261]|uniref:phytanoyl-CoA dioxygenase family protein n=1 Tax=Dyadobacter sp. CY261 TaxID=2907203 RepID=UPI001F323C3C|nr:phytanoyl-CoA dioxygenase family protein [Dyadobacter sp. CY261]MCF0069422.1 phytanoyl-CoA dioxygenase family protein [Dyadobacter sp. CY261]